MTHPTWELDVDNGALILTPCPGTKGMNLIDSIAQLKAQGASLIVTALSSEELEKHQLGAFAQEVKNAGLAWIHAPIEDDCAPNAQFLTLWQASSQLIHHAIDKGEKVVMHCMGGSGRTGLLAAHFLLEKNWPLEEIITKVQALRPGAFTKAVQIQYIHDFAKK